MGSRFLAMGASGAGLEQGHGASEYNRLSLDDSSGEQTAIESGTNSHDSMEMATRVKSNKRSAPPSYETASPHHVVFDQEEEEEDPFEDR